MSYDVKSTLLYALGRAIESEDDVDVKLQMEDLETKLTSVSSKLLEDEVNG